MVYDRFFSYTQHADLVCVVTYTRKIHKHAEHVPFFL